MVPPNEPIGDDESQDTPDWLAEGDLDSDDAMAWLEEIAAKYDPDFEKSVDATESTSEEVSAATAEPVTAPSAPEEDALPDWLADEEPMAAPVAMSPAESEGDEEAEEGELPDWLKDEEPVAKPAASTVSKADDKEDLGLPDWLSDEEPVAAPVPVPAAAAKDEIDELPDWLKDEEPAPAPASASVEDELAWLREPAEAPEAIVSADSEELPDWLKDEEPAAQVAPSMAGNDTEDALAWLNQHVADQGVSPDEIVSEALKVDTPPIAPMTAGPPPDAEAEAVSDEELPDWLKEAGGTEAMAEALASEPSDFDLEDIPELEADDEELAWLADTLDVEGSKADDELAALFGDLQAEEEKEEAAEPVAEVEEAVPAEEAPVPAMAAEPAAAVEEEDLPDWLTEEQPKPSPGLTDWLRSPEAEAKPVEEVEEEEEEEAVPAPAMAAEPKEEPAVEAVPAPPPPAPSPPPAVPAKPVEIPAALQGDFMGQLNTAREKMQAKASDEALALYENLVSHKQMLEQTISDMEYATQSADRPDPRVRRILGDALRASGRLQEALAAYRAALDEL